MSFDSDILTKYSIRVRGGSNEGYSNKAFESLRS